jgi:hypothetical protein
VAASGPCTIKLMEAALASMRKKQEERGSEAIVRGEEGHAAEKGETTASETATE